MNGLSPSAVPSDLTLDSKGINEGMFADSAMSSSRIDLDTTGAEALYKCLDMREPITGSAKQAHQRYAKAASKARRVYAVLAEICSELELPLSDPRFAPISPNGSHANRWLVMEAEARRWCQEMDAQLKTDRIGRVTPLGDNSVRFDFFEVSTNRGIWHHSKARVKTTHELVQARQYRLPADYLEKPAKAQRIVDRIMEIPELARYCRILAGMQVSKASEVTDEWREETRFAKGVKATGQAISKNGKAIGIGAAVLGGIGLAAVALPAALAGSGVAAAAAAVPVAVADPAICLGDIVFYGWD